jgi:hypothetical protein
MLSFWMQEQTAMPEASPKQDPGNTEATHLIYHHLLSARLQDGSQESDQGKERTRADALG